MHLVPHTDVKSALTAIATHAGPVESFVLAVDDSLIDPVGVHMALITDHVLQRGWWPDGFEQHSGFRTYRYTEG